MLLPLLVMTPRMLAGLLLFAVAAGMLIVTLVVGILDGRGKGKAPPTDRSR